MVYTVICTCTFTNIRLGITYTCFLFEFWYLIWDLERFCFGTWNFLWFIRRWLEWTTRPNLLLANTYEASSAIFAYMSNILKMYIFNLFYV